MMKGLAIIVRECPMTVSVLPPNVSPLQGKGRAPRKKVDNISSAVSDNPIRKRMERIERSLQSRQPGEQIPEDISSALEGVECLLGLGQPQQDSRESVTGDDVGNDVQSNTITTASPGLHQYSASPGVALSPEGSQRSHGPPALFCEATHKRWAAQSAVGQSCTGVRCPFRLY